jgi:hypothetical protein
LASFDVLGNAVFRSEGQKTAQMLRSYLINKLPLLLATLAQSLFPTVTPQDCITAALSQVDTNAFPTLSAMFDDSNSNNGITDGVRQDFCFACCLHGLIPETAIEGLLGEITYQTLPEDGRYVKETLVSQCVSDPERIQRLVGEIDKMDGNVGAVCQALTVVSFLPTGDQCEIRARLTSDKQTDDHAAVQQQGHRDTQEFVQPTCQKAALSGHYSSFREAHQHPPPIMRITRQLAI